MPGPTKSTTWRCQTFQSLPLWTFSLRIQIIYSVCYMATESSLCNMQPALRLQCCGSLTFCFEEMMVCGVSRIPGPVAKIGYTQFSSWAYMLLSWLLCVRALGIAWPYVVYLNIYVCQKVTFCLREFLWSSGPKHSPTYTFQGLSSLHYYFTFVCLSVCI